MRHAPDQMILIMPELRLKSEPASTTEWPDDPDMTDTDRIFKDSFRAAVVLTGSMVRAERAVTNAIDALEPGCSGDALLVETVRSAVQLGTLPGEWLGESSVSRPPELQAMSLLAPTSRYCFVICVLLGLDRNTCAEILRLSTSEVEEALCQSFLDLPVALGTVLRQ
jgi:hypothetical protein